MHNPIQFTQQTLKPASHITLADMLESPAFQAWITSALSNGIRFADSFNGSELEDDKLLQYEVYRILGTMHHDDKKELFTATSDVFKSRRTPVPPVDTSTAYNEGRN